VRGIIVRYKVKAGQIAENERLVRAVYEELDHVQPAGFRYATFRLDDGQTFIHLAWTETDDGHSPLADIAAFQRFQEGVADRCEEKPVVAQMQEVGSFRFFDITPNPG
jgi:L-rhamnose mutarotase